MLPHNHGLDFLYGHKMSQQAVLNALNLPGGSATKRGSTSFLLLLMTSQQAHVYHGVTWVVLDPFLTRGTILIRDDPISGGGSESDELIGRLVDEGCLLELTRSQVINWCHTTLELVPLKATHAGNSKPLLRLQYVALPRLGHRGFYTIYSRTQIASTNSLGGIFSMTLWGIFFTL